MRSRREILREIMIADMKDGSRYSDNYIEIIVDYDLTHHYEMCDRKYADELKEYIANNIGE